jgi:hypothetical protein
MRSVRAPDRWAASALVFCLVAWCLGVTAVTRAASFYKHRSSSGVQRDLLVRNSHPWAPGSRVTHVALRR